MFTIPTNLDILDFIAQHLDTSALTVESIDESAKVYDVPKNAKKAQGRNNFLKDLRDLNIIRSRLVGLAPAIAKQVASYSSYDDDIKEECAAYLEKQLRLLESTYNVIRQTPFYTLTRQPNANMAMTEVFLLPYLKRLCLEWHVMYPENYAFKYLSKYISILEKPLSDPMGVFIAEHKKAFAEFSDDSTYLQNYRRGSYAKTTHILNRFEDKNKEGLPVKDGSIQVFWGWHIAGGIAFSLIKSCTKKGGGLWYSDKACRLVEALEGNYNAVYKLLLSTQANDIVYHANSAQHSKDLRLITSNFINHIDSHEDINLFLKEVVVDPPNQDIEKLCDGYVAIYDLAYEIRRGREPSSDVISKAEKSLNALLRDWHLGADGFSFAFDIFLAKFVTGKAKMNHRLAFCERVMFESGVDPFFECGLNFFAGDEDDLSKLNLTYMEHMRCRWIGYHNWEAANKYKSNNFINPIEQVDDFLLAITQPQNEPSLQDAGPFMLLDDATIKTHYWKIKTPCVGLMRYRLKDVLENMPFFIYVFQLSEWLSAPDSDLPGCGLNRYYLLTETQKAYLLKVISVLDLESKDKDVDMALIPVL
ncbi:hypothetical protein [Aeromonas hydrophila]|uniref:hypothetical protein n=1 Tax=Aeromonas hydrophila TaxID=644 RepID=UPI00216A97F9|nr:hypothetical protein [Aeromonas hydrophila]MCS3793673.1 hypothetical protein [Aeromonas hydrophila]